MYLMCPTAPIEAPPAKRPLRRDAERNRQLILRAGRELFAERGLSVTLDDIAKRAGVGVGTVYRRFPDRESLVEALFQDRVAELIDAAERARDNPDPMAGLLGFFEHHLELQVADRGFEEVVLSDVYGRDQISELRDQLGPIVATVVERAQAAGELRADLDPTDLPMILGMLTSVVRGTRDSAPDTWRRYLALLLDGMRAAPGRGAPLPAPALGPELINGAMRTVCGGS